MYGFFIFLYFISFIVFFVYLAAWLFSKATLKPNFSTGKQTLILFGLSFFLFIIVGSMTPSDSDSSSSSANSS